MDLHGKVSKRLMAQKTSTQQMSAIIIAVVAIIVIILRKSAFASQELKTQMAL